jgi:hypothetical protein
MRGRKAVELSVEEVQRKFELRRQQMITNAKNQYERIKNDPEQYAQFLERCKRNNKAQRVRAEFFKEVKG